MLQINFFFSQINFYHTPPPSQNTRKFLEVIGMFSTLFVMMVSRVYV